MTFSEIDSAGKKNLTGKYTVSAEDYNKLTALAKQSYSAVTEVNKLKEENRKLTSRIWSLESEVRQLKSTLAELKEKCGPYLEVLKAAPKTVKAFIEGMLEKFKNQENDIMYSPIQLDEVHIEKQIKNKNFER